MVCPQVDVGPVMAPGANGFFCTASIAVVLLPQLFDAVQVTLPCTVPAEILT